MGFDNEKALRLFVEGNKNIETMVTKSKYMKDPSNYESIRASIEGVTKNAFPGKSVQIHFFGSRIMGTANEDSDLDIFVEIDGGFRRGFRSPDGTTSDHSLHDHRFKLLADALEKAGRWIVKERLLKTTVPIIICEYKVRPRGFISRMKCDISLTNGIAVRNTQLIAKLFEVRPNALRFLLLGRRWLKHLGIDFLSGYTITLLTMFFMQSNNWMPLGKKVQENVPEEVIDNYEVQVNRKYEDKPGTEAYVSHGEFFRFFSKFDFDQVMSTSDGKCYSQREYKQMYPGFVMEGILIAGPLNRGYNCGVMDLDQKNKFIAFCKDTVAFFDNKNLWNKNSV